MIEKDNIRENIYKSIVTLLRGIKRLYDSQKSEAATYLLSLIENYGTTLYRVGYMRETFMLNSLLSDFSSPEAIKAIEVTGIGSLVSSLVAANNDFEKTYMQKVNTENKGDPLMPQIRESIISNLFALFTYVASNADQKVEPFPVLANKLNEIVHTTITSFRAQKAHKKNGVVTKICKSP